MAKVSFVIPTQFFKYSYPAPLSMSEFPVGFAYVAASVRAAGHQVVGCNPNNLYDYESAHAMLEDVLTRHLDEHKPDVVALGGICTDYAFVRDAIKITRKRTNAQILLGGSLVGYDPDRITNILDPDFAIKGDAEHTTVMLMNSLAQGIEPTAVPNLIYKWNGTRKKNHEDFHYPDIKTHLYPAFELFDAKDMLDNYWLGARPLLRFAHEVGKSWVVVAGRGCPFRCTFCVHDRETPYSFRPPEDVTAELAHFHKDYDFNSLVILDELFAPNRKRMTAFCEAMIKLRKDHNWDLKWIMQTHANVGLKQEDLHMAKEAGMYSFSYGMESASPKVLTSMRKKAVPEQIRDVIPLARKANVGFGGNYIFGDPAETPETIAETIAFFKEHCRDLHVSMGSIQPYPGSKIYTQCLENGTIKDPKDFYESIDERRYSMAGFPEEAWARWCALMAFFGGKGLWHLPAAAKIVNREITSRFDTITLHATCPHCDNGFRHQHPRVPKKKDMALGAEQSVFIGLVQRFKRKKLFTKLVLAYAFIMGLRYPWFRHMAATVRRGAETEHSVVTGCPNCGSAVRLEWKPLKNEAAVRDAWPQNTGNSAHFAAGSRVQA